MNRISGIILFISLFLVLMVNKTGERAMIMVILIPLVIISFLIFLMTLRKKNKISTELIDYIYKYENKYFNELESKAMNHYITSQKFPSNDIPLDYQKFITTDKEALNLLKKGYSNFIKKTSTRIYNEHQKELKLNLCPKCEKIARTPKAKQCRFCSHNWH